RANAEQTKTKADDDSDMTKAEAFAILGLDDTATEEEIVMAHRRLIQKLHPDTGGNEYLATQLNLAKDVLINA
ncbi:MAG: DnaJ domain-containing protein, partial [Pseudomonadales bacterium]|nr:DnaJ domain-containing protein [Pseudomonadales bacterium]